MISYCVFFLSTQHFLDRIAWHSVEEQQQHDGNAEYYQTFDDAPFVVVPNDVAD
jgi:hypothetical protein